TQRRNAQPSVTDEFGDTDASPSGLRINERGLLVRKARFTYRLASPFFTAAACHLLSPMRIQGRLLGRDPTARALVAVQRRNAGRWVSKGRAEVAQWSKPVPKHRSWS